MTSSTAFKPALTLVLALAAVAGSVAASPARAGELYAGGSIGASHFDNKIDGIPGGNNGGLNGTIYGGYQFNKYFALEAGLADLGHTESNQPLRATAHAGYADAVGFLPLTDKISLLGRAGRESRQVSHRRWLRRGQWREDWCRCRVRTDRIRLAARRSRSL